jgi:hypothetical protein
MATNPTMIAARRGWACPSPDAPCAGLSTTSLTVPDLPNADPTPAITRSPVGSIVATKPCCSSSFMPAPPLSGPPALVSHLDTS